MRLSYMRRIFCSSQICILLLAFSAIAHAQLTPSDDGFTNAAAPTTKYGTAATLNLQPAAESAYLRFDLTAIPAGYTSANIAKATLKLYVTSVSSAGTFDVDFITSPWTEKNLTFNTSPVI